jgi:hypothetical protein
LDQKLPFINPPIVLTVHAQLPELSFEIKKPKEIAVPEKQHLSGKDFSNFTFPVFSSLHGILN